jgi:hypothetical protein
MPVNVNKPLPAIPLRSLRENDKPIKRWIKKPELFSPKN